MHYYEKRFILNIYTLRQTDRQVVNLVNLKSNRVCQKEILFFLLLIGFIKKNHDHLMTVNQLYSILVLRLLLYLNIHSYLTLFSCIYVRDAALVL